MDANALDFRGQRIAMIGEAWLEPSMQLLERDRPVVFVA